MTNDKIHIRTHHNQLKIQKIYLTVLLKNIMYNHTISLSTIMLMIFPIDHLFSGITYNVNGHNVINNNYTDHRHTLLSVENIMRMQTE